ncbi:uncharacterized protein AMSG_11477, partial [Thecamonas trahens ATCC 50062]
MIAADIDADGDVDLVVASSSDDDIAWYENTEAVGGFGTRRVVSSLGNDVWSMFAADIDGDGDVDLASALFFDNSVVWYENTDGNGTFGPQQLVTTLANGPRSVIAADIDGDGDMDFASASEYDDEIAWYPRLTRNAFHFPAPRVVTYSPSLPACLDDPTCLSANIHRLSRCISDTLLFPPGTYAFGRAGAHLKLDHPCTLAAAVPGHVVIDATLPPSISAGGDGGVLFHVVPPAATYSPPLSVRLVNLTITNMGTGFDSVLASQGMRVDGEQAVLELHSCRIVSSTATSSQKSSLFDVGFGGAVLVKNAGTLIVTNSTFDRCFASVAGGAVAVDRDGSLARIANTTFLANTAKTSGGAITATNGGHIELDGVHFDANLASIGNGGAVALDSGSSATLADVAFVANTASAGGALAAAASSSASLARVVISHNIARNNGGGVHIDDTSSA